MSGCSPHFFPCSSYHQSLFGGIERDSYGFTRRSTRGSFSADGGDDDDADGGGRSQSVGASASPPEVNWEPQRRLWNSYLALHPRVSKDDSELKVGCLCNSIDCSACFRLIPEFSKSLARFS